MQGGGELNLFYFKLKISGTCLGIRYPATLPGLTCFLSTEREQVLNSLENMQKSTKTRKIEQIEYH